MRTPCPPGHGRALPAATRWRRRHASPAWLSDDIELLTPSSCQVSWPTRVTCTVRASYGPGEALAGTRPRRRLAGGCQAGGAPGKIAAPADLPERVRDSGLRELAIGFSHAIAAGRLPLIHQDPFDRMLVAQARCEDLTLVTRDPRCRQYDVAVLPA